MIAAKVEFISVIKRLLEDGKILSIDSANSAYLAILEGHGSSNVPSRREVRRLITQNINNVEFIRAFHRNQPDRFYLSAAKLAAIEASFTEPDLDEQMNVVFNCAKIVRKAILCSPGWSFDGTLEPEMEIIIPTKLTSLLDWILNGTEAELPTERRRDVTNGKSMLLAQQIMYQTIVSTTSAQSVGNREQRSHIQPQGFSCTG